MKQLVSAAVIGLSVISFTTVFAAQTENNLKTNTQATMQTKDQANSDSSDKPIVISGKQQTFNIELKANATTGYQWYLKDYNEKLIRPVSYQYETAKDSKMVGQGGTAEFKFKTYKQFKSMPQMTQLTFIYARPWDINDSATTKTVTVLSSNQSSSNS